MVYIEQMCKQLYPYVEEPDPDKYEEIAEMKGDGIHRVSGPYYVFVEGWTPFCVEGKCEEYRDDPEAYDICAWDYATHWTYHEMEEELKEKGFEVFDKEHLDKWHSYGTSIAEMVKTEEIPTSRVSYEKDARSMVLRRCDLDKIPEKIAEMKQLNQLYLDTNRIEKIENLDNLDSLQFLDLSENRIKKIENIERLDGLKRLILNDNHIENIENIDELRGLEYINLENNPIDNTECDAIKKRIPDLDIVC